MNTNLAQSNMVKQQLRTGDVLNNTILGLYQTLPREYFVPRAYKQFAYSDLRIPLGHNETMLTPLEEATILQSLGIKNSETVLEVGTGSGYFTALLSRVAKHVVSVDYYKEFTKTAEANLNRFNIDNVTLYTGDAHRGWMEKAPYDVIVLTGSINELDDIFRPQLMKDGRLFAIIGEAPMMQARLYRLDTEEKWHEEPLFETEVSPLLDPYAKSKFTF